MNGRQAQGFVSRFLWRGVQVSSFKFGKASSDLRLWFNDSAEIGLAET